VTRPTFLNTANVGWALPTVEAGISYCLNEKSELLFTIQALTLLKLHTSGIIDFSELHNGPKIG
jgi:hypothetical protein